MAEQEISKRRVAETIRLLPDGSIERRFRVEFMVGTDGPFSIELAAGEFSPERVRAEMEKIAQVVRGL